MALQPCRECGASVSTEAVFCPRCGVPQPTRAGQPSPADAPDTSPAQPAPPEPGAADAQAWHYIEDGVRHGPVSQAELRAMLHRGEIPLDTPVKSDGGLYWLPISRVPELGADLPPHVAHGAEYQARLRARKPPQHRPAYAQPSPADQQTQRSAQTLGHVVYALQVASFITGVTLFIALVVNYAGRDSVRGTYVNSHFDWQIGTFWGLLAWWVCALLIAMLLSFSVTVFALVYLPSVVWLLYRVVHGWIRLNAEEPV